jgi:hypothetical protein
VKAQLSARLREIRTELFGPHGGPELARRLNLPARQWYNYETGVTVPAEVLLAFLDQTGANPVWLFTGEGPRYSRAAPCAEVPLIPLQALGSDPDGRPAEGRVPVSDEWLDHPDETVAVRSEDDAMHPVLPAGSLAVIDLTYHDPRALAGRIVAARPEGQPVLRWLDVSGRHVILRPNQPDRDHPVLAFQADGVGPELILGVVIAAYSHFGRPSLPSPKPPPKRPSQKH